MDRKTVLGIAIFSLFSVLPVLDSLFDLAPLKLGGVENRSIAAPLTPETFWSEEWQHSVEKWWARAVGFRGFFVRTDNQVSLSLFGELGSQNRQRVIVGKDHYLIEKGYITSYQNSVNDPPLEGFRSIAALVKKTQDFLRGRGVGFVLVISPSKASVMPEKLPAGAAPDGVPLRDYRAFTGELQAQGVTYFDSHEWLINHRAELAGPIFYRSGAHWSQDSGCRVVAEIFSMLEGQLKQPLRKIGCDPAAAKGRPQGQDADLLRLANIWFTSPYIEPYFYPAGAADVAKKTLPKVIFVGSSFIWDPLNMIRRYHLAHDKSRLYYYFKSRAIDPNRKLGTIDPKSDGWWNEVLKSDAVVVEINESVLLQTGFGFFEAMNEKMAAAE